MKRRTAIRNVVIISAGAGLLPSCMQDSKSSIPLKNISVSASRGENAGRAYGNDYSKNKKLYWCKGSENT